MGAAILDRILLYYHRLTREGWNTQEEAQAYCDAARIVWLLQTQTKGVN